MMKHIVFDNMNLKHQKILQNFGLWGVGPFDPPTSCVHSKKKEVEHFLPIFAVK